MLDQNTDRLWYVIGAVLIGAAILLLVNGTAPELFASATDTMSNIVDDVTYHIDDKLGRKRKLEFNMRESVEPIGSASTNHEWLSETAIRFNSGDSHYAALRIPEQYFEIGKRYTISFDMQKLAGDVPGLGGHLLIAQGDDVDIRIDGKRPDLWDRAKAPTPTNSNRNAWMDSVEYPDDLESHHVELSFVMMTDSAVDDNGVIDNDFYIQPNRAPSGGYQINGFNYDVVISDIEYFEHS